jgi:ABC-type multidrug transport system ATPase subunit
MTHSVAITTVGLTRRFGGLTAVDHLDLEVPCGSVYGFLGPNGAGKTTTIRLLLGLIRPLEGEIRLFGRSLREDRRALLRRVGSLVESPSLYPHLTGRENLEIIRRLISIPHDHVDRVLAVVRLEDAAGRRVGGYSSGMKQRLGLAMALLGEPELLILDEPTNGLDPAGIHEIRDLLRRLPADYGMTVFLSSHLLTEVEQVATHIGIIHQGQLRFQGTLEALHAEVDRQVVVGIDRAAAAGQLLAATGWQARYTNDHTVIVPAADRSDVAMINRQLVEAGLNVYSLALQQPSLEDIFLQFTGTAPVSIGAGTQEEGKLVCQA